MSLLSTPINKLHITIKNSPLEKHITQLYEELRSKDIIFHPTCYLSDEWGCPHDTPLIAIPFYLADIKLSELEGIYTDVPAENEIEIMMYLRHEAGHAINYAFQLFRDSQWDKIFGKFTSRYKEEYQRIPDHKGYVVHLPDWYAQKHPDEDFSETFAIWLTPYSDWREKYKDTLAITKLEYVDLLMKRIINRKAIIKTGTPDTPIKEITMTLQEWYDSQK